jgi:hypothetical protein
MSPGQEVSKMDKRRNRELARQRVVGEHGSGKLKDLKILAERYQKSRRRFGLRSYLLASLYNLDLSHPR